MYKTSKEELKQNLFIYFWIFIWVIIVCGGAMMLGITNTWVFCLLCPLYFMVPGDAKEKLIYCFVGGFSGLMVTAAMVYGMNTLPFIISPALGSLLPLIAGCFVIVVLAPVFPAVFNNASFVYMIVASSFPTTLIPDLPSLIVKFFVGGALYIAGCAIIIDLCMKKFSKAN